MIIEEEVYLEHFGKKGMRWGQRKQRSKSEQERIRKRNKKIAIGSAAAVVGVGAIAAAIILRKEHVKIKNIKAKHPDFVNLKGNLDTKMKKRMSELKDLKKQTPKGHPSHEGALKEISNLKSFYNTRLANLAGKHNVNPDDFYKIARPAI